MFFGKNNKLWLGRPLHIRYIYVLSILAVLVCTHFFIKSVSARDFYDYIQMGITPIPCKTVDIGKPGIPESAGGVCTLPLPNDTRTFDAFYSAQDVDKWGDSYNIAKSKMLDANLIGLPAAAQERCATIFSSDPKAPDAELDKRPFVSDPRNLHYWSEDDEVTALGKANERARQFVNWAVTRSAIDQALSLKNIWSLSRNVAMSFMIIVTAVFGLAIILSRKLRSGYRFSAQSSFVKIGLSVLFIMFSASAVFTLISLSEIIMRFFVESLGGERIFNTYFGSASNETNYIGFIGCRDLNIRVKESADTTIFLLKLTNITYYVMGTMLILRKILLWFLLIVSPFLPLLLSFPLIRNTGRIWIGVFFQWLFYGPLFALFFGATARFFRDGIPFLFDFSRVEKTLGYVFPTAMVITYGGPGQSSNGLNNGNYIDTFVEYVVALILWWAVTWFPWWLLRIYRDDCCDGIYSMRNALFGFVDKLNKKPPVNPDAPPPPPHEPKSPTSPKFDITSPKTMPQDTRQRLRLDNPNVVRQAKTESIVTSMNLRATTLKDIVRLETNKETTRTVKQNLALLENPLSATTSTDRQTFLNVRTELFTRASTRNDVFAQRILSTTNRASSTYMNKRNELAKSVETIVSRISEQNIVNLTKSVSETTKIPEAIVTQKTNSVITNITNNHSALSTISSSAKVQTTTVKQVLQSYAQNIDKPFTTIVQKIAESAQIPAEKVKDVLRETQTLIHRSQSIGKLAQTIVPDRAHAKELLMQVDSLMGQLTEKAGAMGGQMVVRISRLILNIIQNNPAILGQMQEKTQSSGVEIKRALENIAKQQTVTAGTLDTLATESSLTKEKIRDIVVEAARVVQSKSAMSAEDMREVGDTPLDAVVSATLSSGIKMQATAPDVATLSEELSKVFADEKVANITKEILKHTIQDEQLVTSIQEQTGLSRKQVQQTLEALSQAPSITNEEVLKMLSESSGVEKTKALQVVREAIKQANAAKSVTTKEEEDTEEGDVEITRMLEDQLEMALNPDNQIDQAIPIDPSGLDEYEDIRRLWIEQYKTGEIPMSEDIHSRLDWVSQDLELIKNVLRKLVSKDENMRQQALDEIGFILPIFLMNSLSGTQLITYLKAKATAAREVKVDLEKVAAEPEKELEDVKRQVGPVEENVKHMEVDEDTGESKTEEPNSRQ